MGRTSLLKETLDAPVVVPAKAAPAAPAISKPAVRKRSIESPGPWDARTAACWAWDHCRSRGRNTEVRSQNSEFRIGGDKECGETRERGTPLGTTLVQQ